MKVNKWFATMFSIIISITILTACSMKKEIIVSNEQEGIELKVQLNQDSVSPNDEVLLHVTLTNHNDSTKEIYVPTPKETEEGIAAVMVIDEKDNRLYQFLSPHSTQKLSNVKERTFYDYVLVELGANESIEQQFLWNREFYDEQNEKSVTAQRGKYILSSFVILDELENEEDYFEPEKQIVSKFHFRIK
ncbi:hypothetical protein [Sporosarcina sp. USHLN248]|uniref:hypothetical protein n=1 Tax=Sporosarcina sp. USHLN248 TaxID=3081300 RepID=UPI0030165503